MARVTIKDLNYQAYEMGLKMGKSTIIDEYSGEATSSSRFREYGVDPLDILDGNWPSRTVEQFEDMILDEGTVEDVVQIARDFMDGIEDGVKSALGHWLAAYKESYK